MSNIPIIDFAQFSTGDEVSRSSVASAVHGAASEVGFMYVKNLIVDESVVAAAFESSVRFFALPSEQKNACYYRPEMNHGYQAVGGQRLDSNIAPDLKETITMRNVPANVDNSELWSSIEFAAMADKMFATCLEGANQVMEAFAIALELPIDFFRLSHNGENIALGYLHYPVIKGDIDEKPDGAPGRIPILVR